ncbi:hypothetical protein L484_016731 [Morus notabilis]|uniref:Uncharacterized protein n=1 Tax=Morus notabilis TaxID=981085 RepID=W9R3K7_9ROSA|nr:hypothetical protein L484_016731 [Morus notabilis]
MVLDFSKYWNSQSLQDVIRMLGFPIPRSFLGNPFDSRVSFLLVPEDYYIFVCPFPNLHSSTLICLASVFQFDTVAVLTLNIASNFFRRIYLH